MTNGTEALLQYKAEVRGRRMRLAALLLALLAAAALWRLGSGEWNIPPARVAALLNPFLDKAQCASPEALVVRAVRLPRFIDFDRVPLPVTQQFGVRGLLSGAGLGEVPQCK